MIHDRFEYILATAECGSLTRASQQLYITQPTLTNYINRLELELQIKIFDRSVSPISVTQAGKVYIEEMKKIQLQTNIMLNKVRQISVQNSTFTIGIAHSRGEHWLPIITPLFIEKFPNINFNLYEANRYDLEKGLSDESIDLAIGVLNINNKNLVSVELVDEPVYLAIPRNFPLVSHLSKSEGTLKNPYHIKEKNLSDIPYLLPVPGVRYYTNIQLWFEKFNISPKTVYQYKNTNTAFQLAGKGIGAIFISADLLIKQYSELSNNLVYCTLEKKPFIKKCIAQYKKDSLKINYINSVLDIIIKNIIPLLES